MTICLCFCGSLRTLSPSYVNTTQGRTSGAQFEADHVRQQTTIGRGPRKMTKCLRFGVRSFHRFSVVYYRDNDGQRHVNRIHHPARVFSNAMQTESAVRLPPGTVWHRRRVQKASGILLVRGRLRALAQEPLEGGRLKVVLLHRRQNDSTKMTAQNADAGFAMQGMSEKKKSNGDNAGRAASLNAAACRKWTKAMCCAAARCVAAHAAAARRASIARPRRKRSRGNWQLGSGWVGRARTPREICQKTTARTTERPVASPPSRESEGSTRKTRCDCACARTCRRSFHETAPFTITCEPLMHQPEAASCNYDGYRANRQSPRQIADGAVARR